MKRVCVFCGSAEGANPAYAAAAQGLGHLLAERGLELVYGGGNIGLMGELADAALAHQGRVIGVIPEFMVPYEVAHQGLTELRVVTSMHDRKALMADLSDGFLALPGGFGTLEEFFEILSWGQLGLHRKPFGLLNTAGYYNHLIAFLDHAVQEKLLKAKYRALVLESIAAGDLLARMQTAHVAASGKMLRKGQT